MHQEMHLHSLEGIFASGALPGCCLCRQSLHAFKGLSGCTVVLVFVTREWGCMEPESAESSAWLTVQAPQEGEPGLVRGRDGGGCAELGALLQQPGGPGPLRMREGKPARPPACFVFYVPCDNSPFCLTTHPIVFPYGVAPQMGGGPAAGKSGRACFCCQELTDACMTAETAPHLCDHPLTSALRGCRCGTWGWWLWR